MRNRLFHCFIVRLLKINTAIYSGSTLIELLLYMGILSIFLLVLTQLFLSVLDISTESKQVSAVVQDGRFILERLRYDIQRADAINFPSLGSFDTTLSLDIGGNTYVYSLSGNDLGLQVNSEPSKSMNGSSSQISSIMFTRIGNLTGKHTVKIQYTVRSTAVDASGPEELSFQTTVGLR